MLSLYMLLQRLTRFLYGLWLVLSGVFFFGYWSTGWIQIKGLFFRTGNGYPQKYIAVFKSQSNWQALWKINFQWG